MTKEIAGGKYNRLLNLKIAIDAKRIIHEERPEFFGYNVKNLSASEILNVTAVYLSALTRFEEENEENKVKTYFETSGGESTQPPQKEQEPGENHSS